MLTFETFHGFACIAWHNSVKWKVDSGPAYGGLKIIIPKSLQFWSEALVSAQPLILQTWPGIKAFCKVMIKSNARANLQLH